MKRHWVIGALLVCIGISLYLRIVLPYDYVFTAEWIKFSGTDAYWQMDYVDRVAPDFPACFTQIFEIPLFVWLLSAFTWCIGLGAPSQQLIDTVGVYFPPVLAAITIIPMYFIGKLMFGKMAGIVAAVLVAILPGEWLGRSILGFTDDHVAEVLFSTTMLLFFVMALKAAGKRRIIYTLLAVLFFGMLLSTFKGAVVFAGMIAIYLLWQIISNAIRHQHEAYPIALLVSGIIASLIILAVNPGIVESMATRYGIFTISMARTTGEMYPLLYPLGTFSLIAAWEYYGLIIFLAPVAILAIIYHAVRQGKASYILLAVWSITTLAMTLEYRRFGYYFAINAALISGWATWYLWQRCSKPTIWYGVIAVSILVVALVIPNYQNATDGDYNAPFVPSDSWCETLDWVKENTPADSKILAWWDYGYWIIRMADREVYVNPSQDPIPVGNVARMFLSSTDRQTVEADYLILDYTTSLSKIYAVAVWAGQEYTDYSNIYYLIENEEAHPIQLYYPEYYKSLMVRLYNFDGKSITPYQSTVIKYDGWGLVEIVTYPNYEEAIARTGEINTKLVGTSPYISPVPLEKVAGYQLVYESTQKTAQGLPEVKVFMITTKRMPHD